MGPGQDRHARGGGLGWGSTASCILRVSQVSIHLESEIQPLGAGRRSLIPSGLVRETCTLQDSGTVGVGGVGGGGGFGGRVTCRPWPSRVATTTRAGLRRGRGRCEDCGHRIRGRQPAATPWPVPPSLCAAAAVGSVVHRPGPKR